MKTIHSKRSTFQVPPGDGGDPGLSVIQNQEAISTITWGVGGLDYVPKAPRPYKRSFKLGAFGPLREGGQ